MNVLLTASTIFFHYFYFPATLILRNNSSTNPSFFYAFIYEQLLSIMNIYKISFCMVMF